MALTQVQGGMILPSTTLTTPIVSTTLGVGNATPSTSGAGITFPPTQSASTDSNTLDDYEEGAVSQPLIVGSTAQTSYYSNYSKYTKIGRVVVYEVDLDTFSNNLASSGDIKIALPFATDGQRTITIGNSSCVSGTTSSASNVLSAYVPAGVPTSTIEIYNQTITTNITAPSTTYRVTLRVLIIYSTPT
jgi:hypothetical protein